MKNSVLAILALIFAAHPALAEGGRQESTVLFPDPEKHPKEHEMWKDVYESWGFAPAIQTSDNTIYVSGIIIGLAKGDGTFEERYTENIRMTFAFLERLIEPAGATLDDIVEITSFHTDIEKQLPVILAVRKELMEKPHPAWTAVGTTGLADPNGLTEIKFTLKLKSS